MQYLVTCYCRSECETLIWLKSDGIVPMQKVNQPAQSLCNVICTDEFEAVIKFNCMAYQAPIKYGCEITIINTCSSDAKLHHIIGKCI